MIILFLIAVFCVAGLIIINATRHLFFKREMREFEKSHGERIQSYIDRYS